MLASVEDLKHHQNGHNLSSDEMKVVWSIRFITFPPTLYFSESKYCWKPAWSFHNNPELCVEQLCVAQELHEKNEPIHLLAALTGLQCVEEK